jgi:hypothetical protein
MDFRRALGGLFVLAVGVATAVACGDTEPPDVPTYGQPNGLSKQPLPPTGNEVSDGGGGGTGSSGGSSGGGGSGSSSGSSSGGAPAVQFACVAAGGSVVDGGACAVSWTNQIYPATQAAGTWACAKSGCHATGGTAPTLAGSATDVYDTLATFTGIATGGYVNPCSTDSAQSSFVCNTLATGACGIGGSMPLGGPAIATADATTIATWVACGAPLN